MTPNYVNSSLNFLKLRRYQRALAHHFPTNFREHKEYKLIESFIALDPVVRPIIADVPEFKWLNMEHTTFI